MFKVLFTQREVDLLCEAIQAHIEAAQDNNKLDEALEWRHLASKLMCSLRDIHPIPKDLT